MRFFTTTLVSHLQQVPAYLTHRLNTSRLRKGSIFPTFLPNFILKIWFCWTLSKGGPMNSCLSVRLCIRVFICLYVCNKLFLESFHWFKTEKRGRSRFYVKILVSPKMGPKHSFYLLFIKFCHYFLLKVTWNERYCSKKIYKDILFSSIHFT